MLCSRTVVLSVTVLWVATVPILYCSNCSGTKFQRFTINNPQAKCLDGSSPAFYLHSADTSTNGNEDSNNSNDTKWVVYFEGGGWCHTHEECVDRMATSLGSSTNYEECLDNFYHRMAFISHNKSNNPLMYSWNRVYVRYCDGGSYAGDSEVNYEGRTIYYRGKHNRDETLRALLTLGMGEATEIVLFGTSAGGLGLYLGIESMIKLIRDSASSAVRIVGFVDGGYFPDIVSPAKYVLRYSKRIRHSYVFMNMSSGTNARCVEHYAKLRGVRKEETTDCIFAQNLVQFIDTPIFIREHLHDLWQLEYIIGKKNPHSFVNEVGQLRLQTIQEVFLANKRNAAFVDSCIAHGSYNHTKVKNLWNGAYPADNATSLNCAQAFQRWISSDEANIQQLYLQNRTFPCLTCCSS